MPAVLLLFVLLLVPRALSGQGADALRPDTRVRVRATSAGFPHFAAGTVLRASGDTLFVQVRGLQHGLLRSDLEELEVSVGKGNPWAWGTAGAAIGGLAGYGAARALVQAPTHFEWEQKCGDCRLVSKLVVGPYPSGRAALVTAVGTALGGLAGYLVPPDRWEPVPLHVRTTLGTLGPAGGSSGAVIPSDGYLRLGVEATWRPARR